MRDFRWLRFLSCSFVLITLLSNGSALHAVTPTPGISMTATNLNLSGTGSGGSTFKITSVNGFSGQVAVTCRGGSNLADLIVPTCEHPDAQLVVPANGSVTGTMTFYPPWQTESAHAEEHGSHGALPLFAGILGGLGLLGLRLRRPGDGRVALLLVALCMGLLSGAVGCLGNGGLQMTPGTYSYSIAASGNGASTTATVAVTVHCSSCP